jgi:hypothetical protein
MSSKPSFNPESPSENSSNHRSSRGNKALISFTQPSTLNPQPIGRSLLTSAATFQTGSKRALCFGLALSVLSVLVASAQPVPKLNTIAPEWVQRGTTAEIRFTGENLGDVTGFLISGDAGISAVLKSPVLAKVDVESSQGGISVVNLKDDKKLTAQFTITAEASLSEREIRLISSSGVSNPLSLQVGHLPEVAEKSPNQSISKAQVFTLPAAISGRISAASESDYYRFAAKKGQNVIVDIYASRFGSQLDSSLALLDSAGKELARNEDINGLDSLLAFKIPEDGDYILQVRDFRYQGGAAYRYRMLVSVMPYVYSVFPYGARQGRTVEVETRGENLDSSKLTLRIDSKTPIGRQELRTHTSLGISNPFPFDVTDLPEISETEPNSAIDQADSVTLPVVINGKMNEDKDYDAFKFKVEKDQQFIFEVFANRFGSSLDALLTLTDESGKMLQRNDDAVGADARITYKFTEAGEYVVLVEDLLGRGGDNFGYRLTIRQPQPDFAVRFLPDNPRIHRNGHTPIRCEVTRMAGFNETVRVTLADLPPGLFCEPLLLTPNSPAGGLLILSATKDCPLGTIPLRMTATANLNGKLVTRTAVSLLNDKAPTRGRAAQATPSDEPAKEAFLTVLDQPPFTLELATLTAALEQDQTATIDVVAQRRDGFTGEIKLSAEGFSAGRDPITKSLDVPAVALKGNESQGKIKLKARLDSEVGTRPALIKGETTIDGQTVVQYSPAFPVTISQVPFVLSTSLKRLAVAALPSSSESAAREAVFLVKADRRAGYTGEITLVLEGLPEGITAIIDKIPANAAETSVKLIASEKAPVGKEFSLNILGTGLFNDRNYKQRPGEIKLAVNAPTETAELATTGEKPAKDSTLNR